MTELALLQQAADWVEDEAWAGEISMREYDSDGGGRWVSEDQGDETSSATDEAGSEPGTTGRDEIATTELQGALAPHESAFQALRSAFEAGFAAERAVDAAMWSAEVGRREERRRRQAVFSAAAVAGAVASRAGLVPSQVLSVWVRTVHEQQVARGQSRRERTDRPADNKRDNERERARMRKTSLRRETRRARRRTDERMRQQTDKRQDRRHSRRHELGLRMPSRWVSAGAAGCHGTWEARAVVARAALCARPQWRPQQRKARRQRRLAARNRPRPRVSWRSTGRCGVVPLCHQGRLDHRHSGAVQQAAAVSDLADCGTSTRRTWLWWVIGVLVLAGTIGGLCVSGEQGLAPVCTALCVAEGASLVCSAVVGSVSEACTGDMSDRRAWVVDWDFWIRTGAG